MTQAPATPELVERLRDERHVMQGDGFAALLATTSEAADALEAQQARIAELEKAIVSVAAEAKGANDVIRLNRDGGGSGRVKVGTAMHRIEAIARQALSSQGRREGGGDGLPELPCGVGPSDLTDPQSQHSDGWRDV